MRVINIKRIVHSASGMMGWNIKRFKVVVVVLNFRTLSATKAHTCKKILEALNGSGNRMLATHIDTATRQCDIDLLGL